MYKEKWEKIKNWTLNICCIVRSSRWVIWRIASMIIGTQKSNPRGVDRGNVFFSKKDEANGKLTANIRTLIQTGRKSHRPYLGLFLFSRLWKL